MSRIELSRVPAIARSQAASSSAANDPCGGPPVLTSRPSRPPRAATASRTAAAGPSAVDRSTGIGMPPSGWSVAVRACRSRAAPATRAPSAPRARTAAAPSPWLPPPTRNRRSVSPRSICQAYTDAPSGGTIGGFRRRSCPIPVGWCGESQTLGGAGGRTGTGARPGPHARPRTGCRDATGGRAAGGRRR